MANGSERRHRYSLNWFLCLTLIRMHDVVPVRVPSQLAEELVSAGFREVRPPRLRGGGVEPVLTLVVTGAGLAADAATILVAKDAAGDFLARLRSWMTRRVRSEAGSTLVIEAVRRSPGGDSRVRVELTSSSADAVPEVDTQALAALLSSVFGTHVMPGGREGTVPPA
jgi:hypothetical protein